MAADGPREVHGSADAFAAPGVTLAWGVLRGATEADTRIVIRIATDRTGRLLMGTLGEQHVVVVVVDQQEREHGDVVGLLGSQAERLP